MQRKWKVLKMHTFKCEGQGLKFRHRLGLSSRWTACANTIHAHPCRVGSAGSNQGQDPAGSHGILWQMLIWAHNFPFLLSLASSASATCLLKLWLAHGRPRANLVNALLLNHIPCAKSFLRSGHRAAQVDCYKSWAIPHQRFHSCLL